MAYLLLITLILVLSSVCIFAMLAKLPRQRSVALSPSMRIKLVISGIIAFISDTLGVGSFAVHVALAKLLSTFSDEELPAVCNGAQVIPGVIEALFFMKLVDVDMVTMVTLVVGTCLGGLVGGNVVSRLSRQAIRLSMMLCFVLLIVLLSCHQLHLMPVDGTISALSGWKLVLGFIGMFVCGSLTSVGVGLFVMVQGVLFLLNVTPLVAFPVMMVAGAMQQPLTTMVFLYQDKIPLKKTLILSISGCVGVFIALPIFAHMTVTWLHSLLLAILIYNLIAISRSYLQNRTRKADRSSVLPDTI